MRSSRGQMRYLENVIQQEEEEVEWLLMRLEATLLRLPVAVNGVNPPPSL